MTTYVYKSTTGHSVNVDDYVVTANPGLQTNKQIEELDTLIGTSINRYDDGVLTSFDNQAPAYIRSVGASTTVAAAVEALSAAMSKGGRTMYPNVSEQGVIRLDPIAYTLEKPIVIDISGASNSRFGLTIEGAGQAATLLNIRSNASPSVFRDPFGDGIWRAIQIKGSASGLVNEIRLKGFRVVSYATQGGDTITPLSDPCRWVDLDYCVESMLDDITVYSRSLSPLSLDQYQFSLRKCYYTQLRNLHASVFGSGSGTTINGGAAMRRCGVGFRFEDNNALTGENLVNIGANLSFHLINEDGLTLVGGASENHNKSFLFDGTSAYNKIINHRAEYSQWSNIVPIEEGDETYFAKFTEDTSSNLVETFMGGSCPGELKLDYSATQSNVVTSPDTINRIKDTDLLASATWTNGAGVSSATNADVPSYFNKSIPDSTEVTYTGSYNQYRQVSSPIVVDPSWGSVTIRAYHKHVSGMGMISGQLLSLPGSTNLGIYGSRPHTARNTQWQTLGASGIPLASTGHSFNAGKLTMLFKRPHGLQAGMRVQSSTSWGSMPTATNLYVESTPASLAAVLVADNGGSISDPGVISSPGNLTIPSDMLYWLNVPSVDNQWQEFIKRVQIRSKCTAITLNGSNIPVLTVGSTLSLATGVKVRFSGFADARLNVDYTVQSGDVSGGTITLSTLGSIADLYIAQTAKNSTGDAFFGWIGLREVTPEFRCNTTNTGINQVHRLAGVSMYAGAVLNASD